MTTKTGDGSPASVDPNEDVNAAQSSDAEDGQQEAKQPTDVNDAGASSDAGEDGKSPAESSAAEGEKEPKSLLDAVTAATKKEAEAEKSPGSEGGQEKTDKSDPDSDTDESEDDGAGELSDKELAALKPKTRKRMEHLSGQVGELRPKAEAMDHLVRYVEEAGLNTEEVNKGFEIMRLMKSDPFAALEQLRPYIGALQQVTGHELPADLQARVNQGHLSEDDARTLVQSQTRMQLATQAATRAQQEAERLQSDNALSARVNDVAGAVSDWERNWAKSDPDYKAKQGRVQRDIKSGLLEMRQSGQAITRESVLKLAEDSRRTVEEELKSLLPRKQPVNPLPNGQGSAPATRQPTSMRDAMQQALSGS